MSNYVPQFHLGVIHYLKPDAGLANPNKVTGICVQVPYFPPYDIPDIIVN